MPKALTAQERDRTLSIRDRLVMRLYDRRQEVFAAETDPGKLADAIAAAQADLAQAYADVTAIVAGR